MQSQKNAIYFLDLRAEQRIGSPLLLSFDCGCLPSSVGNKYGQYWPRRWVPRLHRSAKRQSRGDRPTVSAAGSRPVSQLLDLDLELFQPTVVVLLRLLARSRGQRLSGRAQVRFERSPPSVIELRPLERAEEG